MPNIPETAAAFLACASIGAIWSSCSPDFGVRSVVDRFAQIEPKVLLAVDGYRYGGKDLDRRDVVAELQARDPVARADVRAAVPRHARATGTSCSGPGELTLEQLPFDHPLWVLYSSGHDRPAEGDRPRAGRHPARAPEDAAPAHRRAPRRPAVLVHDDRLDDVEPAARRPAHRVGDRALRREPGAARTCRRCGIWPSDAGITCFGTSAAYISACMKAGVEPAAGRDLSRLRSVGSTGSPLSPEGFRWVYDHVGSETWLFSMSGGTDVCSRVRRRRPDAARSTRASCRRARSARRSRRSTSTARRSSARSASWC